MADDLKLSLGVELDLSDVQGQLNKVGGDKNKIKVYADTKEAQKQINEFKNSQKNKTPAKIKIDVLKGESENKIKSFIDSIEAKYQAKPIKVVLDVDAKSTKVNIEKALGEITNNIQKQMKQVQQAAQQMNNQTGNNLNNTGSSSARVVQANIPSNVPVDKYVDELNKAISRYESVFSDKSFKVAGFQVLHDELTDSYSAAVRFNNALGETTNVMFKLQDIMDDTGKAIGQEWVTSGQRFSASFKDAGKDVEKTLNYVQSQLNNLQTKYDKAFDKNATKTLFFEKDDLKNANFAKPVIDQYTKIKDILDKIKTDAVSQGISHTSEQVRNLSEEFQKLNTIIDQQKNARWTATSFKETDTTSFVERYKNTVLELQNALKDDGVFDRFSSKISNLFSSLDDVKSGSASTADFLNQLRNIKQEIDTFKSSVEGRGIMLAFDVQTDQLKEINTTVDKLNTVNASGIDAVKNDLQNLATEYQNVITQLQSGDLTKDQFTALSDRVKELDVQFKNLTKEAGNFAQGPSLDRYNASVDTLKLNLQKLEKQYADLIKKNPEIASRFENLRQQLENIRPGQIPVVSKDITNLGKECQLATGQVGGLRGALEQAFGGVGSYLARFASATFIISKVISGIKSMVNEVKAVDSSLVELQKVTDLTGKSLDAFTEKAYKVGEGLGRTGQDVIDAVTTFSRAGYDLNEATELAKSALVMTNVGPDIKNTESAASDMISILKAFDKQADESMSVIDKLYNVANKEPLDFGNITQMLVTAGGTLAQTGTSLEETMALLTGAFATMRDTSVANGLIMISQRLRGVKEDGEAIEEAGFMPKLKSMFSEVGIDVEDSNGELRSTYAILNDLAGVWDTLSSKQKQYFGEKVAGNRQVKTLNAIMQNWDVVADTIDKANEAQGAALEGNEMYMESIQGKITQLKSAFQELATTTFNSDFVKVFVDAGTAIVKFTTDLGGLTPILTTLLGLMTSFKGLKIAKGLKGIGDAFKLAFTPLKDSSNALGTLISRIGIAVAAISVLAAAYNKLKESSDAFNKIEKSQAKYAEATDEINNVQSKLSGVEQEINKIQSLGELSFVQEQELARLQSVSAELQTQLDILNNMKEASKNAAESDFSELMENYQGRTSGNTVVDTVDMIKMLAGTWIEGISEGLAEDLNSGDWGAPDELLFREALSGFYNYQKNVEENNEKIVKSIEKGLEPIDLAGVSDIENQRNEFKMESYKDLNKAYQIYSKYKKASEGVERNIFTEAAFSILDEMEAKLTQASNYAKTIDSSMEEAFFSLFDNNKYDFNVVEEELLKLANAGQLTSEAFKNVNGIDSFIKYMDMLGVSVNDAITYLNQYSDAQNKAIEQSNIKSNLSVGTSVDDVIGNMFQNTEFYSKNFSKMISEIEKTGSLSSGSVKDLFDQYPDVANYLQLTANGYTMTTEALHNFIEAQNEETKQNAVKGIMERQIAIEKLQKQIEELKGTQQDLSEEEQKQIDDNNDIIKGYENEISQLKAVWLEANSAADALERYRTASKTANQDAEHTEGQGILKNLQEAWKSGKVGTDDFKAGMDFFLGENWEATFEGDLEKAYQAASKIGEKYFGKDDQKNAENFRKALVDKGFATLDQKTGTLTMVKGSLTEIAEAFGISEAAAESLFGLLNSYSYGDQITFDKEITSAEELEAALKELKQQQEANKNQEEELAKYKEEHPEDVDGINERTEALNKQKEETEKLESAIETAQKATEGKFGNQEIFKMSLEEARAALVEITEAINVLNQNGISPNVELSTAYYDLEDFIKLIDPRQGGGVEGQVNVDAEDKATPKISEVTQELDTLNNKPTAKGKIDIDGNEEVTDKVEDAISSINSVTDEAKGIGSVDVEKTEEFDSKISKAKDNVEDFDDISGEATINADDKSVQDAVTDAQGKIQSITNGPGEDGKWIIPFGVSGEDDIDRISEAADNAANKTRTIKYNVEQTVVDENGNEVAAGEGQVSGSGYFDGEGNFHGAVVSKQAQRTEEQQRAAKEQDAFNKEQIKIKNEALKFYKSLGDAGAEIVKQLEKEIKDLQEESIEKINDSFTELEEAQWPVQPWQLEPGPSGSETSSEEDKLLVPDNVVDGDSLRVTLTDHELPNLPPEYSKEIKEEAAWAKYIKDASWFGKGGYVNLNDRPKVPAEKVIEKGYKANPGDISTILGTTGRIGEKGEIGVVLTPILPNGDVLEPGKVDEIFDNLYFENGEVKLSDKIDFVDLKDVLVSSFDLSKILPEDYWDSYLETYAKKLHEVHEEIYSNDEGWNFEWLDDETKKVEVEYVEENKPDVEDTIEDAQEAADESPIQIEYDINTEDASKAVDELIDQADSSGMLNFTDGKDAADQLTTALSNLYEAEEKVKDFNLNGGSVDEATKAATGLKSAADKFMRAYKTLSAKISTIQTVNITANTQQAIDKINKLSDTPITVNIEGNINKIKLGNKAVAQPYASGTKSSKKGLALVDDGNGPELIEHKKDGTYELGTGDGPRLTKLENGDVVHTAEETNKILARYGKIGKFFKKGLNKAGSILGKSFYDGKKKISGLVSLFRKDSGIKVSGSVDALKKTINTNSKKTTNNKSNNNSINKTEDDIKELESYSKQLFDWIEIKLDKINQKTQDYIKNAKDAIKLTSKNSKLDKSIKQTKKEIEVNKKAEKKYQNQANEIANIAGLDKGIISKIKNGTLEISKYDDSTQKKIQEYQKWYEKAQACKKAVKELTDQEKELAKQKLDNISDYYSNKLENAERARNKVTAERELKEAQGKQETTKTYDSEIKNINTSIKIANKEKSKLEKELKSLTKKGLVKKGDETYREYRNKIADLEIDVINKKREKIEAQDARKQVRLTKSEYRTSAISNRIDRKNEDKEIKELQGTFGYTAQKKYLTDNLKLLNNQNKEYDTQLKLLKEQQKGLDPLSKKYQDIEKSIRQVESAQKANTKAVIEYKNEINRIDIEKLQDKYDAINTKKSNDNYNINYKNKTGKELSSYDYSTLIKDNSAQIKIDAQMANMVQDEMDNMIAEGTKGLKGKKKNKKVSEIKSSKAYKDLQKEYNNYISDSQNLILENIDLNKQRKELPAQKLQYKIENRNRKANAIRNNIEQGTASGQLSLVDVASGEAGQNKLIAIEEKNTKNYQKQKQIYKDMQKDMDVLSPEYQELADKIEALDEAERNSIATQQNLKDEMKDAGLTLLKDDYDKMTDSVDALNDEISIKLAKGLEITKDSYSGLINVGEGQIKNLEDQKQYYEQLMIGMDQSSSKYLEYAAAVRSLDSEIRDVTESMVNWQNEMDNIDLTKLQWSGDELNAEENRLQNAIKEKNAKGKAINRSDYENLKKNGNYRIQNLKEQNEYLKKQQEGMEKNSKAWQDLQRQIESNESSISDIIVDQEEWTNAQNLIEDKALEHSYNQAQNKVSELQDKIKYEDLTGKAIEEGRYKELINYGEDQLEILKSRKAIQQNLLNGLDKESDRYKEIEATINQIGEEERNISSSIAQWAKDLKNVSIDRMKTDYARASYLTDQYNFNIQYKKESGQAIESEDYANIELSNRLEILHLQDQNTALQNLRDQTEEYSKDYIEYQNLINENTNKINNAELESLRAEESRESMLLDNIKEVISRKQDSKEMIEKSIDYKNVVGKEVTSKDYESLLAEEKSRSGQLDYLKTEYEILMQRLIMKNGESAKESEKYLSYEAEIRDLEKQRKDSEILQEKYKKDIQNVRIQRLLDDYNSYAERETEIQGEIDLKKSNGSSVTEKDYQSLMNVQLAEMSYLTLLNKEYNKQKEGMDVYSDSYRELTNKIASNNEAINKYKISIQELYDEQKKIKINTLEFELSDLEDSAKRINDHLSIREKSGQEIYEEYYKRLIDNGNKQIDNLQKQKDAYIELQTFSTNSMYSDKYREYEKAIWDIDSSIRSLTETIIDYKKELYTIKLDKLEWQLNALAEEADKINDIMSLHEAQRIDETSKSYEKLISNGMERIKILKETNKILKDQQSSMDFNSEEYQNIENQIRSNLSAINSIKVSQEQWNDSILDLDIQKLQKYKDALSKNNDQYKKQKELEEAIYNLEKARNQKTVRTYRENVGFVYEAKEESVKEATKSLEDVVQNQLLGKIDDLIDALESSKEDTNVYDENGNLIGTRYMTPQLGNLSNVLSNYLSKKNALIDIAGLKDSLNKDLVKTGGTITNAQQSMSLDIGSIIVNEANDGNELAKAIVGQFPNALLQALYKK